MVDHCVTAFRPPATGARRTKKIGRADNGHADPPASRHPRDPLNKSHEPARHGTGCRTRRHLLSIAALLTANGNAVMRPLRGCDGRVDLFRGSLGTSYVRRRSVPIGDIPCLLPVCLIYPTTLPAARCPLTPGSAAQLRFSGSRRKISQSATRSSVRAPARGRTPTSVSKRIRASSGSMGVSRTCCRRRSSVHSP